MSTDYDKIPSRLSLEWPALVKMMSTVFSFTRHVCQRGQGHTLIPVTGTRRPVVEAQSKLNPPVNGMKKDVSGNLQEVRGESLMRPLPL